MKWSRVEKLIAKLFLKYVCNKCKVHSALILMQNNKENLFNHIYKYITYLQLRVSSRCFCRCFLLRRESQKQLAQHIASENVTIATINAIKTKSPRFRGNTLLFLE